MIQRYRCPNCQVPVSYGQLFCNSCGVSINWQGVSPSAPFGAKDLSTGATAPVSNLPPVPAPEPVNWKQEMQEKSRLWHKKLAYDPTYQPADKTDSRERSRPRGAFIALLVLVILLLVFVGLGLATNGDYFNIFSDSGSSLPGQTAKQGAASQVAGSVTPMAPPSPPVTTGAAADTQNPEQPAPSAANVDRTEISIAGLEQEVHELINQARLQNGLKPLGWDSKLNSIARAHSSDMALRNYFNHVSPEGFSVADRYMQGGFAMTTGCGENIFMSPEAKADYFQNGVLVKTEYYEQSELADLIVQGWMNSPGHRQNILSLDWTVQAIGIAISTDEKVYITENFA